MIDNSDVEVLLIDINNIYGYDLTNYSKASLKRRIERVMVMCKLAGITELRYKILNEQGFINEFIEEIMVNITTMFRDPEVYQIIQKKIIPQLATYPIIRIWHAGCSTGEEVYSLAIMLEEEGLLERVIIYATDISQKVLEKAKMGMFPLSRMKEFSMNYYEYGGKSEFSNYYNIYDKEAKFIDSFTSKIIFASHNLTSDQPFNQFELIICRNVMIYFNRDLQSQVLKLFTNSLTPFGFLVLGSREAIRFLDGQENYEVVRKRERIWKKLGKKTQY